MLFNRPGVAIRARDLKLLHNNHHLSCVMCHASGVMYHLSRVMCHNLIFFIFYKLMELVDGGSVINGAIDGIIKEHISIVWYFRST